MTVAACPSFRELYALMIGSAPPDEAAQLNEHLAACAACAEAYQTFRVQTTHIPGLSESAAASSARATWCRDVQTPSNKPVPRSAVRSRYPTPATQRATSGNLNGFADERQQLSALLAPAQQADEIGRLGPYRVLEVLGAGGMGVVFRGEDPTLKRSVALKILRPSSELTEEARQRFLREARAAAALEHEHIVTVYQVGEDNGVPFLAMQLLQGETLEDRLGREGKLPILEVCRIAREIAEGLDAAHGRGMIHRDIKPSNVWLESGKGRVRIVDFGLVRSAQEDQQLTKTGAVMGTPAYMAPEQARGTPVDFRCDLYSLGCVIYRMCAGRTPFATEDSMALLLALANDQPTPVQVFNPNVPPLLAGLVQRLLSKMPQGRPPTAQAVVEVLQSVEEQITGSMRSGGSGLVPPVKVVQEQRRKANVFVHVLVLAILGGGSYFALPIVLDLIANRGHLLVASDDPAAKVIVKQKGRTVQEATASRDIELAPGDYDLELSEPYKGLKLSKNQFSLQRGGKINVRVEAAPAKSNE